MTYLNQDLNPYKKGTVLFSYKQQLIFQILKRKSSLILDILSKNYWELLDFFLLGFFVI